MSARVQLGSLVELSRGSAKDPAAFGLSRSVGLDHIDSDDLRLRRWSDIGSGADFTRVFRSGDVLFGKRRSYQRKVALADFDGVCSGDILVVRTADPRLDRLYLAYLLASPLFIGHAISSSAGSLSPRIRPRDLERFEFELPSLDEQHRIVEVMRAVDACVYSASATVSAVRLAATVSATSLKLEHTMTLCSMAEITTGSFLRSDGRQADGKYPLIGASGQIGQTNQFNQSDKVIVVGRVGAPGAVHWTSGPAWVSDNAFVVTPHDYEDFWFLVAVLESQDWWREQSGSSQKLLTMPLLRGVQVPQVNAEARHAVASTRVLLESTFIKAKLAEKAANALRNSLLRELIG